MTGEPEKWRVIRSWFTAHSLSKTEPHFVNIVKYSQATCMFLTSTNYGEVKLWDNMSCMPLGTVNTPEFKPAAVMKYITQQNYVERASS